MNTHKLMGCIFNIILDFDFKKGQELKADKENKYKYKYKEKN